ncbi:hypothetical protein Egran_03145, partial [Elaphomyces granulatus]
MVDSIYYTDEIEDTEYLDRYRTGGYHPVRLGDTYKGKWTYKILLKLGFGNTSTVWLGRVLNVDPIEYVALKFVVSNPPNNGNEEQVLKWLSAPGQAGPPHLGKQYVVHPLDSFTINGPNGRHDVFVTEVVGPNFPTVQLQCYDRSILSGGAFPPLPATRVARQLLMALDYLRSRGVVHGDIQPRNLATTIPNLRGLAEATVVEYFGGNPSRGPVLRWDGTHKNDPEIGRSVPAEVVETSSLKLAEKMAQDGKLLQLPDLKIVDFGQAFIREPKQKFNKLPYNLYTPETYRAPEILVYKTFNLDNPFAADLWSAGCAIFYIATGTVPIDTSGVSLLKAWLIALDETAPSTWITALPLIERGCMDRIISSGHDTLDSLIAGLYPYPDKQDFANFLRLILVMRPEKRAI